MTRYQIYWKELITCINNSNEPNKIRLYNYAWDNYSIGISNVLVKLGYVEPTNVFNQYMGISSGYYKKLNDIPVDLTWVDAQNLAKGKKKLNKGKKPFTRWAFTVDKINTYEINTIFNKYNMFPYDDCVYVGMLSRLGYLEKLDRKGNFKIIEKIPENLSSVMANKYLYNNVYKRARKLEKIKEKLINDRRNI